MEAGPSRLRNGGAIAGPGPSTSANYKSKARKLAQGWKKKKGSISAPPPSAALPGIGSSTPQLGRKKKRSAAGGRDPSSPSDVVLLENRNNPTAPLDTLPHTTPPAAKSVPLQSTAGSPRGQKSPGQSRKRRKHDRAQRLADLRNEEGELDEISGSFPDLEVDVSAEADGTPVDALLASESGRKGKRKAVDDYPPTPPSAYRPLRRSVIAGLRLSPDAPIQSYPPSPPAASFEDTAESPAHFDPPAVFSATLPSAPPDTIETQGTSEAQASAPQEVDGLLLPAHIVLDGMDAPLNGDSGDIGDDEGLFFLDEDTTKNVQRYFDPSLPSEDAEPTFLNTADSSRVCRKCKRPGHRSEQCPHLVCNLCGAMDDHAVAQCRFGAKCFKCGQRGHVRAECTNAPMKGCSRCGSGRHIEFACPTHWRIYTYLSAGARTVALEEKGRLVGWQKEAAGGEEGEAWCYNCAGEGHWGDDCARSRGSLLPLDNPSPFSTSIADRGPFATSAGSRKGGHSRAGAEGSASHMRFDDNLPDVQPAFAGLSAGQKGKAKAQASQRHAERVAGMMEDDDDPVWVSGGSGIGGGAGNTGRGGSRATPRGNARSGRPWESERRDRTPKANGGNGGNGRGMPFGHGHLMSSGPAIRGGGETHWTPHVNGQGARGHMGKGISFGRISMPGGGRVGEEGMGTPTQRGGGGAGGGRGRGGAAALVARALGATPRGPGGFADGSPARGNTSESKSSRDASPLANGPPGSSRKKRKGDTTDADAWANGSLGGNVASWGRQMDSAERGASLAKRMSGRGSGADVQATKAKGDKKGGRGSVATAQKYYGGY